MNRYAVLLRGVNVGGVTVKSADLKTCLEGLAVTEVKTLLATGNVVLSSEWDTKTLKNAVETALRECFAYDAWVVVLSASRVEELAAAYPYPADSAEIHGYITFASEPAAITELDQAAADYTTTQKVPVERKISGSDALAWTSPVGSTLDSPLGVITAKAKFKRTTTTRNIRTLLKIRDAL